MKGIVWDAEVIVGNWSMGTAIAYPDFMIVLRMMNVKVIREFKIIQVKYVTKHFSERTPP